MKQNTFETNFLIQRESLSEQVFKHIRYQILSGRIRGGEKIPENTIAQQFGVSRTPIREALKRLDEIGLVQIKPRSYAEVISLDQSEARNIAEVRLSLEKLTVKLLCQMSGELDFKYLRHLQEKCVERVEEGDLVGSYELDSTLHIHLASMTENPHLLDLIRRIDTRIQLLRLKQKVPKDGLIKYVLQHSMLFQAIDNKDNHSAQDIIEAHIMHDV